MLHTIQIYSLLVYNLIIPGNMSHNPVSKYCDGGASLDFIQKSFDLILLSIIQYIDSILKIYYIKSQGLQKKQINLAYFRYGPYDIDIWNLPPS